MVQTTPARASERYLSDASIRANHADATVSALRGAVEVCIHPLCVAPGGQPRDDDLADAHGREEGNDDAADNVRALLRTRYNFRD